MLGRSPVNQIVRKGSIGHQLNTPVAVFQTVHEIDIQLSKGGDFVFGSWLVLCLVAFCIYIPTLYHTFNHAPLLYTLMLLMDSETLLPSLIVFIQLFIVK